MTIFIWEQVDRVSGSYHDGGGMAIIATDLNSARSMIDRPDCEAHTKPPDFTAEIQADSPRIWVFPDAGCC